ncbi:hypothetical protein D9615_002405 [Tricholomella constricta]|uniref:Uncharacterized protein n=1 Tax=Tricholomella constricta TaxID=117010 RepID=A0A8H5HMC3_9AGAR|nr:hypothetical protein D9615_002405 [Tricholomella constricta]
MLADEMRDRSLSPMELDSPPDSPHLSTPLLGSSRECSPTPALSPTNVPDLVAKLDHPLPRLSPTSSIASSSGAQDMQMSPIGSKSSSNLISVLASDIILPQPYLSSTQEVNIKRHFVSEPIPISSGRAPTPPAPPLSVASPILSTTDSKAASKPTLHPGKSEIRNSFVSASFMTELVAPVDKLSSQEKPVEPQKKAESMARKKLRVSPLPPTTPSNTSPPIKPKPTQPPPIAQNAVASMARFFSRNQFQPDLHTPGTSHLASTPSTPTMVPLLPSGPLTCTSSVPAPMAPTSTLPPPPPALQQRHPFLSPGPPLHTSSEAQRWQAATYSHHNHQCHYTPHSFDSDETVLDDYNEHEGLTNEDKASSVSRIILRTKHPQTAAPPPPNQPPSPRHPRTPHHSSHRHITTPSPTPSPTSPIPVAPNTPVRPSAQSASNNNNHHHHHEPSPAHEYTPSQDSERDPVWTPTCTQALRRHWQTLSLRVRFGLFRAQRRMKSRLATL